MEQIDDAVDEFFALELFHGKRDALRTILSRDLLSYAIVKAFVCPPHEDELSKRDKAEVNHFASSGFAFWKTFKVVWESSCRDKTYSSAEERESHYHRVINECFVERLSPPRRFILFQLFSSKVKSVVYRNLTEFLAICKEYYEEYEPDGDPVNP